MTDVIVFGFLFCVFFVHLGLFLVPMLHSRRLGFIHRPSSLHGGSKNVVFNTSNQKNQLFILLLVSHEYLRLVEGEEEVKAGQQSPGLISQHGVSLVGTLNNQQK